MYGFYREYKCFVPSHQGFVIKGINHTGQIFLTRPSVSSCVHHGCNHLERFSSEWGHLSEQCPNL
jgi:hypothetical protein